MTLSILNVSDKSVKLKANAILGIAHPVDQVSTSPNTNESPPKAKCQAKVDCVECPEFLQPMLDNLSPNLNSNKKQKVEQLLGELQDVFMSPGGKLCQTCFAEHFIDTGDHKTIQITLSPYSYVQKTYNSTGNSEMLDQDVIEPSASPWNSPICLLSKKQTGQWRFCVDIRA